MTANVLIDDLLLVNISISVVKAQYKLKLKSKTNANADTCCNEGEVYIISGFIIYLKIWGCNECPRLQVYRFIMVIDGARFK